MIYSNNFLNSKRSSFSIGFFCTLLFWLTEESRQGLTIPVVIVWVAIFFVLIFISIVSVAGPFSKGQRTYLDKQRVWRIYSYLIGVVFAVIVIKIIVLQGAVHAEIDEVVSLNLKKNKGSLIAVFNNQTKKDITILKPLDGSMWCWHMPYYDFSVFDSAGSSMELRARCGMSGLWADEEWPKDYLVVIKSGEAFELPLTLPYELEDGRYQVALTYLYSNDRESVLRSGEALIAEGSGIKYPENIWRGRLKSNLVTIVVSKYNGQ